MNAVEIYRDAESDLEHNRITLGEFEERIKPLTDVEHVVRCKDCKKRNTAECIISSMNGDACFPWNPPDDWFCADGERKDGEADGN